MKNIAMVLMVIAASLPLVGKSKQKGKRYDPVRITDVRQLPGRYVGVDPDYVVNLSVTPEGWITGTMRDFGRTATLSNIRIDGAELTAKATASDGSRLSLHGTFVNRMRDGRAAFGLVVHDADVRIEDVSLSQIFCRKV
jgi:hypothetical protein